MEEWHNQPCGVIEKASLYRRMQCMRYYWPNMNKDAVVVQEKCPSCQLSMDKEESYAVFVAEDWKTPFMGYLTQGILTANRMLAYQHKKLAIRYFLQNGILFKLRYNGDRPREPREAAKEVHSGKCGSHPRKRRLHKQLLQLRYYWSTMKTCHECQVLGVAIHTHPNALQDITTL